MLSFNIHGALSPQSFAMHAAFGDEVEALTPAAPVIHTNATDAYAEQSHVWNAERPGPYVGTYGRRGTDEENA